MLSFDNGQKEHVCGLEGRENDLITQYIVNKITVLRSTDTSKNSSSLRKFVEKT